MDNTLGTPLKQFSLITFNSFDELARLTIPYLLKGNVALSGGSTYGRLFPCWTALKPDCRAATFFPVDERLVDFGDPQSNWGAAYREFLSRVGKSSDKANFAAGAEQYRKLLAAHFHAEIPVFDAVFLGVGDDGHTASLFPGGRYLDDFKSVVLATTSPKPPFQRITLAPAPLIAAKTLIVVIAGKEKKPIVEKIFRFDSGLPIVRIITRRKESLLFFEDTISAA
jgi:6-phosphogluconolactonase